MSVTTTLIQGAKFPKEKRKNRNRVAMISTIMFGAFVVVAVIHSSTRLANVAVPCANRVVILDTSSSDRSPKFSVSVAQDIDSAAASAIVCGNSLLVYGVSGGGAVSNIVTSDDLGAFTPTGPTVQIRSLRFGAAQMNAVRTLVDARLRAAYDVSDANVTSISALYAVAAQFATPGSQVLLLTNGVNDDSVVNLNRPLTVGAGAALAHDVSVASLRGTDVTIVGIAQVDANTPPPSATWPNEVWNFSKTLCHASRASRCRLFNLASTSEALEN